MRKQKASDLNKYLDDDLACAYETRIPEGFSSRNLSFLPWGMGIVLCGMGVFMAHDAALGKEAFWSNPVVLFGIGLALYCIFIGLAMVFGHWRWTAVQMGLLGFCVVSFFFTGSGASLVGILLYGTTPFEIKALVFGLSLAWNGYWVYVAIRGCQAIWADESLRQSVWVSYRDTVVYRQFSAKAAIEQIGIKIHPNNLTMKLALLLIVPLVWWRQELSALFGVPFIHVFLVLFGQSVMVMGLILPVICLMLMIYYPLKIQLATGKPVLLDMMAPAAAPVPSQNS